MKLRVRSTETKETIRIETPNSSSLIDLKTLISSKVSSSPSSPIPPQSILLSLNQKEDLAGDGDLLSLGLTSGDLLFFSVSQSPNSQTPNLETLIPEQNPNMEVDEEEETLIPELETPLVLPGQTPNSDMEVDTTEGSEERSRLSVPCFLRRVMDLERDGVKENLGFLVIAVHAVFLEAGFVACDGVEPSRLPEGWNLASPTVSVRYTLPALRDRVGDGEKVAVLKFSAARKFVSVYGLIDNNRYQVCLDSSKVAPLADMVLLDGEKEEEVFNLWKIVKDGLCLPLMIVICEKNGLPFPPCFARLPTDVKIMILELLPGVDVARVGCVSAELRYLSGNEELWKQKFVEEFGLEKARAVTRSWKENYKRKWIDKKNDAENRARMGHLHRVSLLRARPRFLPYAPQRFPPVIGGDYDVFPGGSVPLGGGGGYGDDALPFPGGSVPLGGGARFPQLPRRGNFIPRCDLRGHIFGDDPDFIE